MASRGKRVKGLFFLLLYCAMCMPAVARAAPTYGTDMPARGGIRMGYVGNFVFKHDLSDSYGNIKSCQNYFDMTWGVYDWLSVDGKIGVGDTMQKGGIHPKVYYNTGFAGGYGFRILALDDAKNKVRVVLGFHHISVHGNDRTLDQDKHEEYLDEWQAAVLGSKKIGIASPYLGVKFDAFSYAHKINEIDKKILLPQHFVGLIMGCDIRVLKEIAINVESRFIDESSLSVGAYYTF